MLKKLLALPMLIFSLDARVCTARVVRLSRAAIWMSSGLVQLSFEALRHPRPSNRGYFNSHIYSSSSKNSSRCEA